MLGWLAISLKLPVPSCPFADVRPRVSVQAFVVFESPEEAQRACQKDRETFGDKFGDRYVRVYPTLESDVPDMQLAFQQQHMMQQVRQDVAAGCCRGSKQSAPLQLHGHVAGGLGCFVQWRSSVSSTVQQQGQLDHCPPRQISSCFGHVRLERVTRHGRFRAACMLPASQLCPTYGFHLAACAVSFAGPLTHALGQCGQDEEPAL